MLLFLALSLLVSVLGAASTAADADPLLQEGLTRLMRGNFHLLHSYMPALRRASPAALSNCHQIIRIDWTNLFPDVVADFSRFAELCFHLNMQFKGRPIMQAALIYQVEWRLTQAVALNASLSTKENIDVIDKLFTLRQALINASDSLILTKSFSTVTSPVISRVLLSDVDCTPLPVAEVNRVMLFAKMSLPPDVEVATRICHQIIWLTAFVHRAFEPTGCHYGAIKMAHSVGAPFSFNAALHAYASLGLHVGRIPADVVSLAYLLAPQESLQAFGRLATILKNSGHFMDVMESHYRHIPMIVWLPMWREYLQGMSEDEKNALMTPDAVHGAMRDIFLLDCPIQSLTLAIKFGHTGHFNEECGVVWKQLSYKLGNMSATERFICSFDKQEHADIQARFHYSSKTSFPLCSEDVLGECSVSDFARYFIFLPTNQDLKTFMTGTLKITKLIRPVDSDAEILEVLRFLRAASGDNEFSQTQHVINTSYLQYNAITKSRELWEKVVEALRVPNSKYKAPFSVAWQEYVNYVSKHIFTLAINKSLRDLLVLELKQAMTPRSPLETRSEATTLHRSIMSHARLFDNTVKEDFHPSFDFDDHARLLHRWLKGAGAQWQRSAPNEIGCLLALSEPRVKAVLSSNDSSFGAFSALFAVAEQTLLLSQDYTFLEALAVLDYMLHAKDSAPFNFTFPRPATLLHWLTKASFKGALVTHLSARLPTLPTLLASLPGRYELCQLLYGDFSVIQDLSKEPSSLALFDWALSLDVAQRSLLDNAIAAYPQLPARFPDRFQQLLKEHNFLNQVVAHHIRCTLSGGEFFKSIYKASCWLERVAKALPQLNHPLIFSSLGRYAFFVRSQLANLNHGLSVGRILRGILDGGKTDMEALIDVANFELAYVEALADPPSHLLKQCQAKVRLINQLFSAFIQVGDRPRVRNIVSLTLFVASDSPACFIKNVADDLLIVTDMPEAAFLSALGVVRELVSFSSGSSQDIPPLLCWQSYAGDFEGVPLTSFFANIADLLVKEDDKVSAGLCSLFEAWHKFYQKGASSVLSRFNVEVLELFRTRMLPLFSESTGKGALAALNAANNCSGCTEGYTREATLGIRQRLIVADFLTGVQWVTTMSSVSLDAHPAAWSLLIRYFESVRRFNPKSDRLADFQRMRKLVEAPTPVSIEAPSFANFNAWIADPFLLTPCVDVDRAIVFLGYLVAHHHCLQVQDFGGLSKALKRVTDPLACTVLQSKSLVGGWSIGEALSQQGDQLLAKHLRESAMESDMVHPLLSYILDIALIAVGGHSDESLDCLYFKLYADCKVKRDKISQAHAFSAQRALLACYLHSQGWMSTKLTAEHVRRALTSYPEVSKVEEDELQVRLFANCVKLPNVITQCSGHGWKERAYALAPLLSHPVLSQYVFFPRPQNAWHLDKASNVWLQWAVTAPHRHYEIDGLLRQSVIQQPNCSTFMQTDDFRGFWRHRLRRLALQDDDKVRSLLRLLAFHLARGKLSASEAPYRPDWPQWSARQQARVFPIDPRVDKAKLRLIEDLKGPQTDVFEIDMHSSVLGSNEDSVVLCNDAASAFVYLESSQEFSISEVSLSVTLNKEGAFCVQDANDEFVVCILDFSARSLKRVERNTGGVYQIPFGSIAAVTFKEDAGLLEKVALLLKDEIVNLHQIVRYVHRQMLLFYTRKN